MRGKRLQETPAWLCLILRAVLTIGTVLAMTAAALYILRHWGLEAMLILFVTASGAFWGWAIRWLWRDGRITWSHILVIWMVWTGTILGGASYYLAYRGLNSDLETLSRYVMVEVVAGIGGYFIKSGIENVLKGKQNGGTTKEAANSLVDIIV